MNEQRFIESAPRADSLKVSSAHDQWNLHAFAFEYELKPARYKHYHPDRFINGELMEGYYDDFVPEAYDTERGQVLKKEVVEQTTHCPECNVPARKYDGDTMCPECGLLCNQKGPSEEIIRDAKAAGRIEES
jgi:hypothetical protein